MNNEIKFTYRELRLLSEAIGHRIRMVSDLNKNRTDEEIIKYYDNLLQELLKLYDRIDEVIFPKQ
jgi:hypothetical protein